MQSATLTVQSITLTVQSTTLTVQSASLTVESTTLTVQSASLAVESTTLTVQSADLTGKVPVRPSGGGNTHFFYDFCHDEIGKLFWKKGQGHRLVKKINAHSKVECKLYEHLFFLFVSLA